jgi:hypothetical protein
MFCVQNIGLFNIEIGGTYTRTYYYPLNGCSRILQDRTEVTLLTWLLYDFTSRLVGTLDFAIFHCLYRKI